MEKIMHKGWIFYLSLLAIGMAACAGKTVAQVIPTVTIMPLLPTMPSQPDCTVVTTLPTLGPTERSRFPAVSDSDWSLGLKDAAVTIIEYSDFQ